jgi:membrane protein DedA with SNARE-associated domain/rhodanese-related sulfurtransferase
MKEVLRDLAGHSYSVLFASVFARQICLPVPAILFLIAAGSLAGSGKLSLVLVLLLGVTASVLADFVWFEAGRLRGDAVLHLIHRFSLTSDSSVARVKRQFATFGPSVLFVSKLVIGLDAIAPPLAGMSRISPARFVSFDAIGAAVWAGLYAGLGYVFYSQLDKCVAYAGRVGALLTGIVAVLIFVLCGHRILHLYRLLRELRLARITPEELERKLNDGEEIIIIDVQGCPLHRTLHKAIIPGAIRIDGRRLSQYKDTQIPADWRTHDVVLCCSCPNEITSARVALLLERKGVKHVRPLAGGLQRWIDCRFPVTPDRVAAPGTKATSG